MCSKVVKGRRVILVDGSTNQWFPLTGWIPCSQIVDVNSLLELREPATGFTVQPAYQLAETDTDAPRSPQLLGSTSTATEGRITSTMQDLTSGHLTTSQSVNKNMWARFGVAVNSASGGNPPARGEVLATFAYRC